MASKRHRKVVDAAIRERQRKDRLMRARRARLEAKKVDEYEREARDGDLEAEG